MTREGALIIIKECKEKGFKNTFYTLNEYHTALDIAIKALEQEPCDDAISRQAAVETFQMFREYESNRSNEGWVNRIETVLNQLPPVNPQPKVGHWIDNHNGTISCSRCGTWFYKDSKYPYMRYCPYCNEKMAESESKE